MVRVELMDEVRDVVVPIGDDSRSAVGAVGQSTIASGYFMSD